MEKEEPKNIDTKLTTPVTDAPKAEPPKRRKGCCLLVIIGVVLIFGVQSYSFYRHLPSDPDLSNIDNSTPKTTETTETTPQATTNTKNATTKPQTTTTQTPVNEAEQRKNKLIDFFIETANTDDANKSLALPLVRWTLPEVSVGVAEGQFTDSMNSCLNTYISDLNSLISNVKFVRNDTVDLGIPKVKIYFWTEAAYQERWGDEGGGYALEQGLFNDDNSFKRVQIFISQKVNTMDDSVRCQLIRHEMTHGLGFWGHSDLYPASIMSLPKTSYSYPEEDKIIIRMLYNSGIPLGTSGTDTRTFLQNNFNY